MRAIPLWCVFLVLGCASTAVAEPQAAAGAAQTAATSAVSAGSVLPAGYVIGPDDVLSIVFWKDKDLSADVTVRPDGKVSLPLLNDIQAEGRAPEQLRDALKQAALAFVEDPNPTVMVKEIKSRRVFITGQVEKPGPYPLTGETTVLQLIAMAGGIREFADSGNITIIRKTENGRSQI